MSKITIYVLFLLGAACDQVSGCKGGTIVRGAGPRGGRVSNITPVRRAAVSDLEPRWGALAAQWQLLDR
jgi:hypothetical protein